MMAAVALSTVAAQAEAQSRYFARQRLAAVASTAAPTAPAPKTTCGALSTGKGKQVGNSYTLDTRDVGAVDYSNLAASRAAALSAADAFCAANVSDEIFACVMNSVSGRFVARTRSKVPGPQFESGTSDDFAVFCSFAK